MSKKTAEPGAVPAPVPAPRRVWAYLRVSTDAQDVANQRHGVLEYANGAGLSGLDFIEDAASGRMSWKDRKLGQLLKEARAGDVVVFAEISRIARSTLQVLEVLQHCMDAQISVHIAKQRMILDGSMQSRITATVLGLAAEIEREFISMRTREALEKRRAEGMTLGRPRRPAETTKLDARADEIRGYLSKKISKRDIARLVECAPSTLYAWLERRNVKTPAKPAKKGTEK